MTTDEATHALARFIQAQSPAEMAQIFESEPALRGPEVAEWLQQKEQEARQQGLQNIANDLAALRKVLSEAGEHLDIPLPDAPGCKVAAELIIALIDAAPDSPLPAAALSAPFFLVTGAWRVHMKQHQVHRLEQLEQLDARVDAVARTMDKRQRRRVRDVLANLERWLDAQSWQASSEFLAAHKGLLSPDTAEILELLAKGASVAGAEKDEKFYRQHLDILARVPAEGTEPVFEQLITEEEHKAMQQRFRDETLSGWLAPEEHRRLLPLHLEVEKSLDEMRQILDDIETALNTPSGQRINYYAAGRATAIRFVRTKMPPEDLRHAQVLYLRAAQRGGAGITAIEQGLLDNIAAGEDLASTSFWLSVLDIRRPRDSFSKKRHTLALAALARLAIRNDSPEAVQALRDLLHHKTDGIRSNAVYYLGQVYLFTGKALPPDVRADMETAATSAPDFASRFHARNALRYCQLPVPIDNPGGVFSFLVSYLGSGYAGVTGVTRTIEITSEQTLENLNDAILNSVSFDADHLYAFHMTGDERDARFEFDAPESTDDLEFGFVDAMWGGGAGGVMLSYDATIGQLGLIPRHKFLYVFDFGDQHKFAVQVGDLLPRRNNRTKYPRIVARKGKSPEQYPSREVLADGDSGDDDSNRVPEVKV